MGSSIKKHLRVIIPVLLVVTIILSSTSVALFSMLKDKQNSTQTDNSVNLTPNDSSTSDDEPISDPMQIEKSPISTFNSIIVTADDLFGKDSTEADARNKIDEIIKTAKDDGFDTVELLLNHNGGLMYSTEGFTSSNGNLLVYFSSKARQNGLKIFSVIDLQLLTENRIYDENKVEEVSKYLSYPALGKYSDMVIFKNCYAQLEETADSSMPNESSAEVLPVSKTAEITKQQLSDKLTEAMKQYYLAVAESNSTLAVGVELNESALDENAVQDIKAWLDGGFVDFVKLYNPYSTENDDTSFTTYYESTRKNLGLEYYELHCTIAYENIGTSKKGWQQTDQILHQLKALDTLGVGGIALGQYNDFVNDKTESRNAVKKYFSHLISNDYVLKELSISKPTKRTFTTHDKTVLLMGASDPEFQLKLNGNDIERNELGYFSLDLELNDGLNTFKITHKGITRTYKITYERIIIKEIFPTTKQELPSRSTLSVSCVALSKSKVTATLADISLTLNEEPIVDSNGITDPEYSTYIGLIELPTVYDENRTMGKITFKVQSNYGSDTKKSENIVILKEERPVVSTPSEGTGSGSAGAPTGGAPWVMPEGGSYIDVGNTLVGEVIGWQLEMFDANAKSDYSRPTNNYLPKGTVDYASTSTITTKNYILRNWRYGKTTYDSTSSSSVKYYYTTLPDHNSLNVASIENTGRHTVITLDTLWKAPFKFNLAPQDYPNNKPTNRDYTITAATYTYVDLTFCYSTLVAGDITIPEDNPIFKSAEWINSGSDYTLRLHLKKTGKFYGWSADYNENNQLVFTFLNPAKITAAENSYGHRLDGVKVLIDVGHGGSDQGASGSNPNFPEAKLNLTLALKLKAELESIGATVIMTREDNTTEDDSEGKKKMLRQYKPDYCISIHRNSADSTKAQGFISYHFNAFSSDAAKLIYKATENSKYYYTDSNGQPAERDYLYKKDKWSGTKWHVYYMGRQTDCPVVLTENGFMSNSTEYSDMIKDDFNQSCAVALTKGIIDYFKSIQ